MKWSMLAAAIVTATAAITVCAAPNSAAPRFHSSRLAGHRVLTTQFTYTATVPASPAGTKALDLWIPLPSDGPYQTIKDVTVDSPSPHRITTEPKYRNRIVYVRVADPSQPVKVVVKCTVERKEIDVLAEWSDHPGRTGPSGPSQRERKTYLVADKNVPLGGRYGTIAEEVAGGKTAPIDKIRAIYDHVVATMQYDYKKESPKLGEGDVAFVCDYKKGNCSDLHSYLISLARSQKIPAYLEYGFPITGIPVDEPLKQTGKIAGYHCWVWFQDPQHGWLPLDASDGRRWLDAKHPEVKEKLVGSLVLERSAVAFSKGRDLTLVPAQKGEPLNMFIYPYAEVDGTAVKAGWEVTYILVGITGS